MGHHGSVNLLAWEMIRYSLIALAGAVGSVGVWLCVTAWTRDRPARFGGIYLVILAVVLAGIWQDVRLDHLCAIHGNCR